MRKHFSRWAALLLLLLVQCRPTSAPVADRSGFENAVGAAVIEQMIADSRAAYSAEEEDLAFALVLGEALRPPSAAFLEHFRRQGLDFLEPDDLDYDRVTKATVIKGTRTNPVVLQLIKIHQIDPEHHQMTTAWNRGSDVVRKVYEVRGDPHTATESTGYPDLHVEEAPPSPADEEPNPATP